MAHADEASGHGGGWAQRCAVLIPCVNEEEAVASVVKAALAWCPTVVVVDDGSRDRTAVLARAAGACVVVHRTNRGKGASLKSGFDHLRSCGFSWALTMDGDGQHAVSDIPRFFRKAEESGAVLIIGHRLQNGSEMSWLRYAVNRCMTRLISQRVGWQVPDSQCGFRLVNLESLTRIRLRTEHFETESEMLLAFAGARFRVESVPIQVIGAARPSRIRPIVDTWRWLRWWFGGGARWEAGSSHPR